MGLSLRLSVDKSVARVGDVVTFTVRACSAGFGLAELILVLVGRGIRRF